MTMTWKIDPTGKNDLTIKNGKVVTINGVDEVQQRIVIALRHYWEEYFLNVPAGVPWYELILGNKDIAQAEAILREVVFGVPGVVSILNFSLTNTGNNYSIEMNVEVQVVTNNPAGSVYNGSVVAILDVNAILNSGVVLG